MTAAELSIACRRGDHPACTRYWCGCPCHDDNQEGAPAPDETSYSLEDRWFDDANRRSQDGDGIYHAG